MKSNGLMVTALIAVSALFASSYYTWWRPGAESPQEGAAIDIAVLFLKNGPTFKFDGITDSIKVVEVLRARTPTPTWLVMIDFECSHVGYGDREGQFLAQVITPHSISVTVEESLVIDAVIDNAWDEITQEELYKSEIITPEYAKDKAIEYILSNYPDVAGVPLPEFWTSEMLTTPGLIGVSTWQFVGEGWEVNVSFPVVMEPDYDVTVRHAGDVSFTWKGKVDKSSNVEEERTSLEPKFVSAQDARDLVVEYLIATEKHLMDSEPPMEWDTEVLQKPNVAGHISLRFTGDGWSVTVSNAVVQKPVYQIELEYIGEVSFSWTGTVDQDRLINEDG